MRLGDDCKLLGSSTNYSDPMQCRLWNVILASLWLDVQSREVNIWNAMKAEKKNPSDIISP